MWADWDEELLKIELLDLQASDYDLALTGFDTKEIDDLILDDTLDEDAAPPLPSAVLSITPKQIFRRQLRIVLRQVVYGIPASLQ
jgi:hypothetical protein